jgi:glycosyltransferase involved in cell wall biosynthesis
MKILVTFFPDLKKMPAQRPHHLLKYLSAIHKVTIINTMNAWWWEEKADLYREECLKGLDVHYAAGGRVQPLFQEVLLVKNLERLSQKFDFSSFDLHLNISSLIAGYFISKKMRQAGIPTLFDICDDFPQRFLTSQRIPWALRPLAKTIGKNMLGRNLRIAERITYVTQSLGDSYHFPPAKSVLIPNGVDSALFYNQSSAALSHNSGTAGPFVVGFVGFMNDWVDLEPVLAALGSLKREGENMRLLVGGDGSRTGFFKTLAEKQGISDIVHFAGFIPHEKMPQFMGEMDCCLISLKPTADCQNAFPLTLLEYMASGKPVIATPLAGVKETVGDKVLYASGAENIKECILRLYRNRELRNKLGNEGKVFVKQKYTWERIGGQFEEAVMAAAGSLKRNPSL